MVLTITSMRIAAFIAVLVRLLLFTLSTFATATTTTAVPTSIFCLFSFLLLLPRRLCTRYVDHTDALAVDQKFSKHMSLVLHCSLWPRAVVSFVSL